MASTFSVLPPEMILHIFKFVDSITIRRSVCRVNKLFRQLSRDFTLYECYEVPQLPYGSLKAEFDLRHPSYKKNLHVLAADISDLDGIKECNFSSLRQLVLHSNRYDPVSLRRLKKLGRKRPSITVRGELGAGNIDNGLMPLLREVETVVVEELETVESAFKLPARSFLIQTYSSSVEYVPAPFRSLDDQDERKVQFELHVDCSDVRLSRYLQLRVVKVKCNYFSSDVNTTPLLVSLCRDLLVLEELDWCFKLEDEVPVIAELATDRLRTLRLETNLNPQPDGIFSGCRLLMSRVRNSLELRGFELRETHDFRGMFQKLTVAHCTLPIEIMFSLQVLEELRMEKSLLRGNSRFPKDHTVVAGRLYMGSILTNLSGLLDWCRCTSITLGKIQQKQYNVLLNKLTAFSVLEEFGVSGKIVVDMNTLLKALRRSRTTLRQLSVYGEDAFSTVHSTEVVVNDGSLQLLTDFPRLEFILMEIGSNISERLQRYFPVAYIHTRKSNLSGCIRHVIFNSTRYDSD